MAKCPQCGNDVAELIPIDIDLRTRIKALDPDYPLLDEICRPCVSSLRKRATNSGGVLMAQERAREDRKGKLWKSRTSLVKQGHSLMAKQLYSEAAISYEKYLKLLEMCFEKPAGGLTPEILKDNSKTVELTVIAGVYWDLVRVYDTSDMYGDRQKIAAKQLALFVPYTPIFPDIIKKATVFQRQARHPEVIKSFLSSARKKRPRCFIATSAFLAPAAEEVNFLRQFRDHKLKATFLGRKFVFIYYKTSPTIACILDKHECMKPFVRAVLRFVIKCVR
jgi:hypothetical protein